MAYNYEYPYADLSRGNVDWLLSEMKRISETLNQLIDEFKDAEAILGRANEYTDEQCRVLRNMIQTTNTRVESINQTLTRNIDALAAFVNDQDLRLEEMIDTNMLRTQQQFVEQWNATVDYVDNHLAAAKVRNFFTGELTSIQAMFDYLSRLHLEDAGTYTEVSGLNTYAYYEAKNQTYEYVTMNSKPFFEVS